MPTHQPENYPPHCARIPVVQSSSRWVGKLNKSRSSRFWFLLPRPIEIRLEGCKLLAAQRRNRPITTHPAAAGIVLVHRQPHHGRHLCPLWGLGLVFLELDTPGSCLELDILGLGFLELNMPGLGFLDAWLASASWSWNCPASRPPLPRWPAPLPFTELAMPPGFG